MLLPQDYCSVESASSNITSSSTSLRIYTISTTYQLPKTLLFAILEPSGIIHLLQSNDDGNLSLAKFFENNILKYIIFLHR